MTKLTLAAVKQDFDVWRASRSKIGKIPEPLWNKALELLKHCPISEISKALSLSGGQIKAKREQLTTTLKPNTLPKFVEISAPSVLAAPFGNSTATCKLSLTRTDGATIMLEQVPEHILMQILGNFYMNGGLTCCN